MRWISIVTSGACTVLVCIACIGSPVIAQDTRPTDEPDSAVEGRPTPSESTAAADEAASSDAAKEPEQSSSTPAGEVEEPRGDLRDTHRLLSADELVSEEFPGSWPMFGTDVRMKIGGYVKSDFVADFDGTLDETQFLMSTIPVEGSPEYGNDGYVSFFAKETRFNLDVRRVAQGSPPLRAFVEGDFFSENNQFRLRHAYMTVGDFVIGQTWTTLSFLESLPFVIDFAAGDALFGGRAAQFRYQRKLDERWKVAVALEELAFLGIENPDALSGKATRRLPLLAVRADYAWDGGLLLMGSSVAELHWDGGSAGPSDSAVQYDVVVAGRQNVRSRSFVTWNVSYGDGSGENIMAFAGSQANAVLEPDGQLETFPAFAAVLGFGRAWNSKWSSNLSYAYGWLDTPPSRADLALKRGGVGHVNLVWKPTTHFSTGVEYMWGTARAQNDAVGRAQRFQFMGKYEF